MESVKIFLSDPVVSLTGYIISFVSGSIAIIQYLLKNKAQKEVIALQIEIRSLQENTKNENTINQGNKSQYFQENSGPVSIDNRD